MRALTTILSLIFMTPAFAHGGHVGELAGHAHWIGLGAILGAGIIAAALLKGKKQDSEDAEAEEAVDADEEAGETA